MSLAQAVIDQVFRFGHAYIHGALVDDGGYQTCRRCGVGHLRRSAKDWGRAGLELEVPPGSPPALFARCLVDEVAGLVAAGVAEHTGQYCAARSGHPDELSEPCRRIDQMVQHEGGHTIVPRLSDEWQCTDVGHRGWWSPS